MATILHNWDDTIIALATPQGVSAIGVIRLSGTKAIDIVNELFPSKNLFNQPSHSLHVGIITYQEKIIDEVVISLFRNPKSYTGEDIVEISCHGSPYIQQQIINACIDKGARTAKPGEFTQRAFLNGKLDLTQAEGVADLIASESKASHEIALQQMRGGFSSELKKLRDQLIHFASLIELELDFSEEDVEFADRKAFTELLHQIEIVVTELINSFQYGNVIKKGVPVAIIGKPNTGKSSLLNALLNEERAIVSNIPGTTRDSIEDILIIDGITFRFIDTAGLRKTDDIIEAMGVQKAKEKVSKAKIILYLYDKNDCTPEEIINHVRSLYNKEAIFILVQTKIDITNGFYEDDFLKALDVIYPELVQTLTAISVYQPETIKSLKGLLTWEVQKMTPGSSNIVTNSRHLEALQKTKEHLMAVQFGLEQQISGDLLAQDLRFALRYLAEITGEIDVDKDILGTIFSKFCIGK